MLYTHLPYHNDSIIGTDARKKTHNKDAGRKTQEGRHRKTSLEKYLIFYLSVYCKGSKGLFKVCM